MDSSTNNRQVVVTDIQMPFGSMVVFMIKWALAAIPAALIFLIITGMATGALLAVLAGAGLASAFGH